MRASRRVSMVLAVSSLVVLSACPDEESGTQEQGVARGDAAADGGDRDLERDAGGTAVPGEHDAGERDAASGETAIDAGTGAPVEAGLDAGPACPPGEMLCDDECIADIDATATALQTRVLSQSCALSKSCHTGFSPKEGLNLTTLDDVFATAVDKASKQDPARKIIDPGNPEDSYLIAKLRNLEIAAKASTGKPATQMPPPPLSPLCEAKVERFEAWIRAGAKRD